MTGIQANGIGSGLDVNGLVTKLLTAEATPLQQRITRHEMAVTTKVSALGTLKGALSAFKAALEPLKTTEVFQARKATSGDTDFFAATADSTAAAGHYDVKVVNMAKAHQLSSGPFVAGSAASVGYGTLTITVGTQSFAVTIAQEDATLGEIRDAINNASDNTGVQATLLNGSGGSRLVLTAANSGSANAIKVAASGGDGGLNQLVYDPLGTMNLTQLEPAQNALIRIEGYDVTSSTNVFEDAIDGVTITAKASTGSDEIGLDVIFDAASVQSRIQKFVTEYNNMQGQLSKLGSYDAATRVGGPLLGDSLLRNVESELRRSLTTPVSGLTGDYTTLASIGIKTTANGTLQLDTAKLTAALDTDADAVAKLFGSDDGVAARMYEELTDRLAAEGDIAARNTRLSNELKDIAKDKEALVRRLEQIEIRYRKQFTALDTLLTQMQSTSSYLTQQLASLPKAGG